jgi:hypothetical protein
MIVADLGELAQAAGKAVDAAECIKNTPSVAAASACIRAMVMGDGKTVTKSKPPPPTLPPPATKEPETPKEVAQDIKAEEVRDEIVGANIVAANVAPLQPDLEDSLDKPPAAVVSDEGWFSKYWPYMAGGAGVLVFLSVLAVVTRR